MALTGISATGSPAGAASASSLGTSAKSIAGNFDTFLSLLTTQLKNQNPLDPLDTNQFTQQLVQFSSVEQQLKTNEFLQQLVTNSQSGSADTAAAANQAVGLIGKQVVAGSSAAQLKDGHANWTYTLATTAPNATINIRDASGNVVFTKTGGLPAGQNTLNWDGKDSSGLQHPDGMYSITIDAKDADGNGVKALTQIKGVVQSVDLTGSDPVLMVNGSRVYLDGVLSVSAPDATT